METPLKRRDVQCALRTPYNANVVGRLGQSGELLGPCCDPLGNAGNQRHRGRRVLRRGRWLTGIRHARQRDRQLGFLRKRGTRLRLIVGEALLKRLSIAAGDGNRRFCRGRDCVAGASSTERCEPEGGRSCQQPGEQNIGVRPVLVDVQSGVSAEKAGHLQPEHVHVRGQRRHCKGQANVGVKTSRGAQGHRGVILGIKVDVALACEQVRAQRRGARHLLLFVRGEEEFKLGMWSGCLFGKRQRHRNADAVVSAQRRVLRAHPLTIPDQWDRVFREVMLRGLRLDADHVHVGLQNHPRPCLPPRCRRDRDEDVPVRVARHRELPRAGPVDQPGRNPALIL